MEEKKYIITENEQKQRLDTYVASLDLKLTRSQAQRMIKENSILVNGKISKESYKTKIGDEITIKIEPPKEAKLKPQDIPLDIIYEI